MTIDGTCSECGGNQTNSDQEGPCECLGGYEPDPGKIFTFELFDCSLLFLYIFFTSKFLNNKSLLLK